MANLTDVRRRLIVERAIVTVGKGWEYFGRIADTRGFADRAAGAIDELERLGFTGSFGKSTGRLADVGRLFAAYRKLTPPAPEPVPEPTRSPRPDSSPTVEILAAPGPVGEAQMVARHIRKLMAVGVSPTDIVVTARDVEATADVFAEVLDEYAVPAHGFPAPPLARAPVVAFLLRAWRVPANNFAFAEVTAVLRSTFFRPPDIDPDIPTKAEALLQKIGGPDGDEAYLKAVERWAVDPPAPLEDETAETAMRKRTHVSAKTCQPFLKAFFALWGDTAKRIKPRAWIDRLKQFANACGVESTTHTDDSVALNDFWADLDVWVDLLPAATAVPSSTFGEALSAITAAAAVPVPPPAIPSVRILAAEDARHAPCDYLFLTGLGEGAFPQLAPPDSLLTDADRIALRKQGVPLPDPAGRREAEQELFDDLLARPRKGLVLSYPAVDAKGQEQLPSSFLADWRERNEPVTVTKRTMRIQKYAAEECYSDAERRVRYANGWKEGRNESGVAASVAESLQRAREVASARFGEKSFTRFDGGLSREFLTANLDLLGKDHVFDPTHTFSPTALERYGACPFRFWLDDVLGVEPLDDPPDAVESTRRGSAIHRALARFHRDGPNDDDPAGVRGRFDEAVAEYRARAGGPVVSAVWELEGLRLRRTANRYPGQWQTFRGKESKGGPTPVPKHFEAAFGLKPTKDRPSASPLVLTIDTVEVRIGGTIDRIDAADLPDGVGFWVIDYKSGRGSYYTAAAVSRLEALQLPLYALAAERVLLPGQTARPLGLAYWLVTDTGPKAALPKIDWPTFRDQLERWVVELVQNIRTAAFPLNPRSPDCTATCPHGPVCRITQHRNSGKRVGSN